MPTAKINDNGLHQIANALGRLHKLGQAHFTPAMLGASADAAEESFANGNDAAFEIASWDSATGRAEVVVITADGYDVGADE